MTGFSMTGWMGVLGSLLASAGCVYVLMRRNRGNVLIKALKRDLQHQTEQLQQEQERLVANENFHAAVLDSLAEHIAVIDERGIILAVNQAWRRFARENGGTEAAVNPLGSNYLEVCQQAAMRGGADGASEACEGMRAVLERRCSHFEMEYPCDSPTEKRWFRVSVTLMQGALRRVVVSHKNISQERSTRAQLEQVNRSLEASLSYAQALLVSANQASLAKSQFLSTMSHEIRTPLHAILGMLQLLQGTALSPQQPDYIHKAVDAARGLLRLINDILDFSKVEAGKLVPDFHAFPSDQLRSERFDVVPATMEARPIEVLSDSDADMPEPVMGDLLRLKQVLTNLADHAMEFTHNGVVHPTAALAPAMAALEGASDVIDVAGALAWVDDDIAMYRKLLDSFLDDVRCNADQLQTHFERDEQSDAVRVLHTLKGLARTVGALELSRLAAHAEARFKHTLSQEDAQWLVMQIRAQIESATQALLEVAVSIDAALHAAE